MIPPTHLPTKPCNPYFDMFLKRLAFLATLFLFSKFILTYRLFPNCASNINDIIKPLQLFVEKHQLFNQTK